MKALLFSLLLVVGCVNTRFVPQTSNLPVPSTTQAKRLYPADNTPALAECSHIYLGDIYAYASWDVWFFHNWISWDDLAERVSIEAAAKGATHFALAREITWISTVYHPATVDTTCQTNGRQTTCGSTVNPAYTTTAEHPSAWYRIAWIDPKCEASK